MRLVYVLSLTFCIIVNMLNAQNILELGEGQKFVSGGFYFDGERRSFNSDFKFESFDRQFSMYIYAHGARMLNERTAVYVGTRFGHSLHKGNISYLVFQGLNAEGEQVYVRKYGYYQDKYTSLGLTLGLRRFWWLNDRFYGAVSLGLEGYYNWSEGDQAFLNLVGSEGVWRQIQLDLSLKPGAMYLLSKRFGLEAELVGLNLGYKSRPEPEYNPTLSLQLSNSDWLNLGLVYFLR